MGDESARVPEKATHDEEAQGERGERWRELGGPEVWTERMVAALETGVKGCRWFSLMDRSGRSGRCKPPGNGWSGTAGAQA